MKLEDQLAKLESLGLPLDRGITIDDVLYSFDRASFEKRQFDLLLFLIGADVEREPWGRPFCSRAWNFDTECIYGDGSYVQIVERLAKLANVGKRMSEVSDHVDMVAATGWVEYTLDDEKRRWDVEVNDDWADVMVVTYVMDALESPTQHFYQRDNGQAMVLYFLTDEQATAINELAPTQNTLMRVISS